MKRFLAAGAAGMLLLLIAGCGSSASGGSSSSSGPLRYFVELPESGAFASYATPYRQGVQASVDVVNAAGGILGRKVQVTFVNDSLDPSQAVQNFQSFRTTNTIDLLAAGISSVEATALYPLSTRYKIVTETSASPTTVLDNTAAYPYAFTDESTELPGLDIVVKTALKAGVKTLGVVLADDVYGEGVLADLRTAVAGTDLKIDLATFTDTSLNLTPTILKVMSGKPQMLFMDANGSESTVLLKARVLAGADSVPTIAGYGISNVNIATLIPGAPLKNLSLLYTKASTSAQSQGSNPALTTMEHQLKVNGVTISNAALVTGTYTLGYDWIMYYRAGVDQAKSFDPVKVSAAMENLPVAGPHPWATWPTGPSYTPTNHTLPGPGTGWIVAPPGPWKDGVVQLPAS